MKKPCLSDIISHGRYFFLLLAITIPLSACASARISQFDKFALAGIKFTDSLEPVLDNSLRVSVETDSLILIERRKNVSGVDARLDSIEKSNVNIVNRIHVLNDIKRHVHLLRSYFLALRNLAETDEASGISDATKGLVDSLGKLDERIKSATIGAQPIKDFIGETSSIAVASFKSAAMTRELKERASVIESELNLLEAAIEAISIIQKSDQETQLAILRRDLIELPYAREGELPTDWSKRRFQYFQQFIQTTSTDAALEAARNLRLDFVALAENRLDEESIALLLRDIDQIVTRAQNIAGTQ